jgi:hypothetical protein
MTVNNRSPALLPFRMVDLNVSFSTMRFWRLSTRATRRRYANVPWRDGWTKLPDPRVSAYVDESREPCGDGGYLVEKYVLSRDISYFTCALKE